MQLSLTNVVNISVSEAQTGIGNYNVNNLALFTRETPADSFGDAGYAIYLDPTNVATDFGSDSVTFAMANSTFSQQPNILAGGGYLAVIPFLPNVSAVQTITITPSASSGGYSVTFNGSSPYAVTYSDSTPGIQAGMRTAFSLPNMTVTGNANSSLILTFVGYPGPAPLVSISSNTTGSTITRATTTTGHVESLAEAIVRTTGLVQYFGIMSTEIVEADASAAAAVVQPLNKILFICSYAEATVEPDGLFDTVRQAGFTKTRCLYYGDTSGPIDDTLVMMAAYAGRALSTNFAGSNTTQTMHLKDLTGVLPDPTMTQTILNKAIAAGADTYVSLQGVPKVFTSGANKFYDQVYNLGWFVGALQVAGFNYLAESSTKIPQTEQGMTGLKSAYRAICQQANSNQYIAPGSWTSSTTFGNQIDFLTNVAQLGYYVYSQPVSQQNQADRADRKAPLVQIAIKEAGAIQSSDVIVYVNA